MFGLLLKFYVSLYKTLDARGYFGYLNYNATQKLCDETWDG